MLHLFTSEKVITVQHLAVSKGWFFKEGVNVQASPDGWSIRSRIEEVKTQTNRICP
jgi:hypothetical protein